MTNKNPSPIEEHLDQMSEHFADLPWKNADAPTQAMLDLHRRLGALDPQAFEEPNLKEDENDG